MGPRAPYQIVVAFAAAAGIAFSPVSVAAAQGDPRMKEVKAACAGGDFERGVKLLAEMYVETNDPTAIYNQGRCYQQNAEPERAAARFREYLRKARDLSPADRSEVEGFIKECDAEAGRKAQRAAAGAATIPAATAPQTTAPPAVASGPASAPPYGWVPAPAAAPYAPPYPAAGYPPQPWTPAPAAPVRKSRRKGLLIGGVITLGASYLLTALVGKALIESDPDKCSNCKDVGQKFYVPIFGPWIAYNGDAKKDSGNGGGIILGSSDDKREDLNSLAALAGLAQGVGTALTAVGILVFSVSGGEATTAAATPSLRLVQVAPTRGGAIGTLRGSF